MSSQAASWWGGEDEIHIPGHPQFTVSQPRAWGLASHSHILQNQLAGNGVRREASFTKPVRWLHGRVKPMLNNSSTFYLPFAAIISSLAHCCTFYWAKQVTAWHPIKSSYLLLASTFIPSAQMGKASCVGEACFKAHWAILTLQSLGTGWPSS